MGRVDMCTSGSIPSAYVDIYNATSSSWTRLPEGLGQPRAYLAAAALPSGLVIFAGGLTGAAFRASDSLQTSVAVWWCAAFAALTRARQLPVLPPTSTCTT